MTRLAYAIGMGVIAVMLAGCAASGPAEQPDGAAAPQTQTEGTEANAPGDPAEEVAETVDPCALYDGIELDRLINTTAGDLVRSNEECSFGSAIANEYASSAILVAHAPGIVVFRGMYEGDAYDCDVVDIEGLGDEAFTCFGRRASSSVVFTQGEVMVIFNAGNSAEGPPEDATMIDAAQQISANLKR